MKKSSRLGIFQCSDKDGIIDDYIIYLLNDIKENLDRLVVIFNGALSKAGRDRLYQITKEVVVRENEGFDAAAWRFALTEYLGWDVVGQYDELVLLNDTFFGPFYPFKIVFDKMAEREVDFWGLTAHGKGLERPLGVYYEEHIQSYFFVIRKDMLNCFDFKHYWEKQKTYGSFQELVEQNEVVFTKYFEERGFVWEPFIDMSDLDGRHVMNHYAFNAVELLKRGFPVIKRKQFQESLNLKLRYHNGEDYKEALQYIQNHYSYDVSMIWQNILRIYNIGEIHDALGLDYVIDNKACHSEKTDLGKNAAVVLHLTYTDMLDQYLPYIKVVPEWMDVVVTTVSKEKAALIRQAFQKVLGERLNVLCMCNRGRDLAGLLVAAKPCILKYDYFCFCHDKVSAHCEYSIGKYFERLLWENTLSSTAYIENIVARFQEEPKLGILAVPSPVGGMIQNFGQYWWSQNYQHMVDLLKELDVEVPVSESIAPLSLGTAFWCRTSALKKLFDHPWSYKDFPKEPMKADGEINHALERCFPFVAQHAGYYTAVAMTPEYAGILVNAYKYLTFHSTANIMPNYLCMTDADMPNVGVRGALHLLFLTVKQYLCRWAKN